MITVPTWLARTRNGVSMGVSPYRPYGSTEVIRNLRTVMENVEFLWEREVHDDSTAIISTSQLRVLYVLERAAGVNLRELGEAVGSAASPLSRLCARLEAMGFVKRVPSPQSRREIELHLTRHAFAYLKELRERKEMVLAAALDSIPAAKRQSLAEGLDLLRTALESQLDPATDERTVRSA